MRNIKFTSVIFSIFLSAIFSLVGMLHVSAAGSNRYVGSGNCGGQLPCYTTLTNAIGVLQDGDTIIIVSDITEDISAGSPATNVTIKGDTASRKITGTIAITATLNGWTFTNFTLTNSIFASNPAGTFTINNLTTGAIVINPAARNFTAALNITNNKLPNIAASEISIVGPTGGTIGGTINISGNTGVNAINILTKVASSGSADLNANITLNGNTYIKSVNIGVDGSVAGHGNVNGSVTATNNVATGGFDAGLDSGPGLGVTISGLTADVRGNINGPIVFTNNTVWKLAVITSDSNQGDLTGSITAIGNDTEAIEMGFHGGLAANITVTNNWIHYKGSRFGSFVSADGYGIGAVTINMSNNTGNTGFNVVARQFNNDASVTIQGNQGRYIIVQAQASYTKPFTIANNALTLSTFDNVPPYLTVLTTAGSIIGGTVSGNSLDKVQMTLQTGLAGPLTASGNYVGSLFAILNQSATGAGTATITGNNFPNRVYLINTTTEMHYNRIIGDLDTAGATVNAQNNWWGCNSNPGLGSPCHPHYNGGVVQPALVMSGGTKCLSATSIRVNFNLLTNFNGVATTGNTTPAVASIQTTVGTVASPSVTLANAAGATIVTIPVNGAPTITVTIDSQVSNFTRTCEPHIDAIGVFRPSTGTFYMRNSNTTGTASITSVFGASTDLPVVGDWNADGISTVGVYRPSTGQFLLSDSNSASPAINYSFVLGAPGDMPMAGDWDGDGRDGAGVFRPSNGLIYLKNNLTTGFADFQMVLGVPGDAPVAGDWNSDGFDSPGVYRPSSATFYLSNQICNCSVFADYTATLGIAGDSPVAGDWDGNASSGIGVFRPSNGLIYLKNTPTTGFADINIVFGIPNDKPVAGHWSAQTMSPSTTTAATPAPKLAPTFVP
ncbi:MAG: hypothetical protein ABI947_25285 [Chloroflexota bacterium]